MGGVNVFAYAANAPTKFLDRLGLKPTSGFGDEDHGEAGGEGQGGSGSGQAGSGRAGSGRGGSGAGAGENIQISPVKEMVKEFFEGLADWINPILGVVVEVESTLGQGQDILDEYKKATEPRRATEKEIIETICAQQWSAICGDPPPPSPQPTPAPKRQRPRR